MKDWQQLPRPDRVQVYPVRRPRRCRNMRSRSRAKEKERTPGSAAARRLYAAVLAKALSSTAGSDVGVIIYKSTREWIEQNCFVPPWMKLVPPRRRHRTNVLEHGRAPCS